MPVGKRGRKEKVIHHTKRTNRKFIDRWDHLTDRRRGGELTYETGEKGAATTFVFPSPGETKGHWRVAHREERKKGGGLFFDVTARGEERERRSYSFVRT